MKAAGLLHLAIGPWRHSGANHYGYELGDADLHWRHGAGMAAASG